MDKSSLLRSVNVNKLHVEQQLSNHQGSHGKAQTAARAQSLCVLICRVFVCVSMCVCAMFVKYAMIRKVHTLCVGCSDVFSLQLAAWLCAECWFNYRFLKCTYLAFLVRSTRTHTDTQEQMCQWESSYGWGMIGIEVFLALLIVAHWLLCSIASIVG